MAEIPKSKLKTLYDSREISDIWESSNNVAVIKHPQYGLITPNAYRAMNKDKPCPYCGKKMLHGKKFHSTQSKTEAIKRGYEYIDNNGRKIINKAGNTYFHPHYLTLDHKINKARCPESMFDYDNLEAICWKCNSAKSDDNAYEITHTFDHLNSLVDEALSRYKPL
ncbi:HNH endonuclease [Richelia sinica]|uniref:HNH endonuclease n=1 Tax=Richelia sinica TaxID=1357545 RepID=UPI00168201DE|nr:HNH endonuclease [Richelia sinica]MBD2667388.1 HNH endonuclease [Richelia sinica FACHB-800]